MKSTQKKATSNQGALEVRLNRAMEETEKYKTALQKARVDSKVGSGFSLPLGTGFTLTSFPLGTGFIPYLPRKLFPSQICMLVLHVQFTMLLASLVPRLTNFFQRSVSRKSQ